MKKSSFIIILVSIEFVEFATGVNVFVLLIEHTGLSCFGFYLEEYRLKVNDIGTVEKRRPVVFQ